MISIEEAIKAARDYARQIYTEDELEGLRVEEIESTEDDRKWLITLGWNDKEARTTNELSRLITARAETLNRVYKVFTIDAETARVESMTMHE